MRLRSKDVEQVLKELPATRNSDIALTIALWVKHYPQRIKVGKTGERGIWLRDLFDLPREDHVKRIRAKFNAEGKYLPTDARVAKQRKLNEEKWLHSLGYVTKEEARDLFSHARFLDDLFKRVV